MFRFTIRELLLFTLVVALAVGWWIDRSRLRSMQQERDSWRRRAEAVRSIAEEDDYRILLEADGVRVYRPSGGISYRRTEPF
jgi:hypothetical protein